MSLESRLRKIEPKAERRHVECVLSEVSARLHGAGPDCCQVFAIHVAPDILADRPGDATALASL